VTTATARETPDPGRAEPAEGLRSRKKRLTREQLHKAALQLVSERGLAGVTTDEIASAAGVSARTFFNYYATKEAAVVGASADLPERVATLVLERPADEDPIDALVGVFRERAEAIDREPELRRLRQDVLNRFPELVPTAVGSSAGVERAVAAAVAHRLGLEPDTHPYPALVTTAVMGAVRTAITAYGRSTDSIGALSATLQDCVAMLRAGLPAPTVGAHAPRG